MGNVLSKNGVKCAVFKIFYVQTTFKHKKPRF